MAAHLFFRTMAAAVLAAAVLFPASAAAQEPVVPAVLEEPIGPFVVDARGVLARFGDNASVASAVGVATTDLPARGIGLVVGAHVYPARKRGFALGLGGELLLRARGSHTVPPAVEDGPDGPTVVTRLTAVSPQVSLNFGSGNGWSYVSGGIGWSRFTSELADDPWPGAAPRPRTLTYGGGARWFAKEHLAFTVDLRFYSIAAQEAVVGRPAFPAMRLMVVSAGIGIK